MSDFELARAEIEEVLDFPTLISVFENESEQRRSVVSKKVIGFRITTPRLTKIQMQAHRTFFIGKQGALTGFTFTSPFDDTEYTVRYQPGSFTTTYQEALFVCSFEFKVINTDEA